MIYEIIHNDDTVIRQPECYESKNAFSYAPKCVKCSCDDIPLLVVPWDDGWWGNGYHLFCRKCLDTMA